MAGYLLVLVACLVVLVYASDKFVDGAANLATRLKMSTVVVGVLIIGFGTSAPELVVSVWAIIFEEGSTGTELAIGNVVGSNVANLTLVLAIPAFLRREGVVFAESTKLESRLSLFAVLSFAGALLWLDMTWYWGTGLLALLYLALRYIKRKGVPFGGEPATGGERLLGEWGKTLFGLAGTVVSAHFLVWSAISIAEQMGLTTGFIGFTLVALGTSLPEVATVVAAARRGETGLIIGNLLGSNLFNSLGVGGAIFVTHWFKHTDIAHEPDWFPIIGMAAVSLLAYVFLVARWSPDRVTRTEGAVLGLVYLGLLGQMALVSLG